ncbi:helicase [Pectobacterium phage POP12]|nr:helicase [Pectobacterium phage POP12]
MNINIKFIDTSHVQIETDQSILYEMRDYFSFQPPGYQYQKKFKYGGWNGFIYLLDYNGKLPYGLAHLVHKFAEARGYTVTEDPRIHGNDDLISREDFNKWIESKEIYSGTDKIKPHWYQADSVFHAINSRRAVLNLPTSAGKSLIQCLISRWFLESYEGKVLIIVPTVGLVSQMINDFVDYRIFPRHALHGIKSGSEKDTQCPIVVSTWQSASKQPPEWFRQFKLLMVDECHLSTGQSIKSIIENLTDCVFKFGLSGSLKEGKANMMQYVGAFGKIFKPVDTNRLMMEGQVTDLKINTLLLRYPEEDIAKLKGADYQTETSFVTGHTKRNKWICKLALKLAMEKNENVFLMFKNIKHGKWLYEHLKKHYDNVVYIAGETSATERDEMKKIAESTKGLIVVGSIGVLSTGISIKNLHHIIFAHPCKSAVIVKQSIGRVLRKHESKLKAMVWDIIDNLAKLSKSKKAKDKYSSLNYGMKHGRERIGIYNQEKFDYSIKEIQL